jgi:hypothetical protein
MKISERFDLEANQFTLDFVDINTDGDTRLFLDPSFIGLKKNRWAESASRTIRSFFETFVDLYRAGQTEDARALLQNLHEPNETCLGLSKGHPRGNAIGEGDGDKLFVSIAQSRAMDTGIIEDLEDFRLFVPGIDKDKISDMTTNIIRRHLISYTQEQAEIWGIPLTDGVATGPYWSSASRQWEFDYAAMLVIEDRPILLTPKSIVSYAKRYSAAKYHSKFVVEFVRNEHLRIGGALVQYRKNGAPFVTKKDIIREEAPLHKEFLATFTERHPEVFADFKEWFSQMSSSIPNRELDDIEPHAVVTYLKRRLREIQPGRDHAADYHRTSMSILELVFYPDVVSPKKEREIHQGRKRVDFTMENAAPTGFFNRLPTIHRIPSSYIFIECKNYSTDVANPEIDQLAGRFDVNKGQVGLLLCRTVDDMPLLLQRCADAFDARRDVLIPMTDEDLVRMLDAYLDSSEAPYEALLAERFRAIVDR